MPDDLKVNLAKSKKKESTDNSDKSNASKVVQNQKKIRSSKSGIPKPVANRMARRIAITTGLPTISGMSVFVISYILVSKGIADIAPGITLVSSALCFLTGLLGLSYGILSAIWEESNGSILGLENIKPNINRVRSAFSPNNNKSK